MHPIMHPMLPNASDNIGHKGIRFGWTIGCIRCSRPIHPMPSDIIRWTASDSDGASDASDNIIRIGRHRMLHPMHPKPIRSPSEFIGWAPPNRMDLSDVPLIPTSALTLSKYLGASGAERSLVCDGGLKWRHLVTGCCAAACTYPSTPYGKCANLRADAAELITCARLAP